MFFYAVQRFEEHCDGFLICFLGSMNDFVRQLHIYQQSDKTYVANPDL
jgi:hypothetical protein